MNKNVPLPKAPLDEDFPAWLLITTNLCVPASTCLLFQADRNLVYYLRSPENNSLNPPLEEKILTASILAWSHIWFLSFRALLQTKTEARYLRWKPIYWGANMLLKGSWPKQQSNCMLLTTRGRPSTSGETREPCPESSHEWRLQLVLRQWFQLCFSDVPHYTLTARFCHYCCYYLIIWLFFSVNI